MEDLFVLISSYRTNWLQPSGDTLRVTLPVGLVVKKCAFITSRDVAVETKEGDTFVVPNSCLVPVVEEIDHEYK